MSKKKNNKNYEHLKNQKRTKSLPDYDGLEVYIRQEVYDKVYHWINKSDHEVSGFGSVVFDAEAGIFTVTDAILLEQENGPTSSEISGDALATAMYETREVEHGLKWWWHSHVNMRVFWSGDDMECIRSLGQRGWLLSTVFNKRHESRSSFYTVSDFLGSKHEIFSDELRTVKLKPPLNPALITAWDSEYNAKVKKPKPMANFPYKGKNYAGVPKGETPMLGQCFNDFGGHDDFEHSEDFLWNDDGEGISWEGVQVYNPYRDKSLLDEEKFEAYQELPREDRIELAQADEELVGFLMDMRILQQTQGKL